LEALKLCESLEIYSKALIKMTLACFLLISADSLFAWKIFHRAFFWVALEFSWIACVEHFWIAFVEQFF
jgi:hypothetical protein